MTCYWRARKCSRPPLVEIVHVLLRIGLAVLALVLGWGLLGIYGAAILSGLMRSLALVAAQPA